MFRTCSLLILVLMSVVSAIPVPSEQVDLQSMPEYAIMLKEFKKLQSVKTKEEMKSIMTIGLVSGALQVQRCIQENLSGMVRDLLDNVDMDNVTKSLPKVDKIERTMLRNEHAITVLGTALDAAMQAISIPEFRSRMKKMMRDYHLDRRKPIEKSTNETVRNRLEKLKTSLASQMDMMETMIKAKCKATLAYLEDKHGITNSQRKSQELNTTEGNTADFPSMPLFLVEEKNIDLGSNYSLMGFIQEPIENNLIEDVRRQDASVQKGSVSKENLSDSAKDNDDDDNIDALPDIEVTVGSADDVPPAPGGSPLIGLIAGLSGGENGSDVGALVGALTGVVMNLFGPGGLDIPGLLGAGSSLIAGLLSGDRNFGTVLGEYIGLAVDGFSGGGGAVNNGRFFGNFLGTLVAELSANPEDDDLPPQPSVFIQTFLNTFVRAKNKSGGDKDDAEATTGMSNSFGFITHIVRTIVGGITNFILGASMGSSGASSQGSSTASAGSSGHRRWG